MANPIIMGLACICFCIAALIIGITYNVHKDKLETGFKVGFWFSMPLFVSAMCIMLIAAVWGAVCCATVAAQILSPI